MPTSSERLRQKIELVLPEYRLPGRLLLEHPHAGEVYPCYMGVVYHLMRTAVPLIETALAESERRAGDDPVAAAMVPYLEQHVAEELHGEVPGEALLSDLEHAGVDPDSLRNSIPSTKIASLVGAQYYYILHQHPVAVLGYFEVVEGYHPQLAGIERLVERTGLPRRAFNQLFEHAILDVAHRDDLEALIDDLPLGPRHEELMGISALLTVGMLSQGLLEVVEQFDRSRSASPRSLA